MISFLLQASGPGGPDPAAAAGVFALVGGIWCCGIGGGIGQLVMAIIALVQVLSREPMAGTDKLLWALVSWLIPIVGPILWWTIGSKQHPKGGRGGPPAAPGQF